MQGLPERFIDAVNDYYSDHIEEAKIKGPRVVELTVKKEFLIRLAQSLRDDMGFTFPSAAGGMDYLNEERMQMIYYVQNPKTGLLLIYKVNIPRDNPVLPTMTQVWDAMSFHEREAHEMFGIHFEGHPDMKPLLLPPDWKGGYPLRKDFKGEGVE